MSLLISHHAAAPQATVSHCSPHNQSAPCIQLLVFLVREIKMRTDFTATLNIICIGI